MIINGTRRSAAIWLIKDSGSGSSFVQIENASTGQTVLWNNALTAGQWLRFTSNGQKAEVSSDSGSNWTTRPENTTGVIPEVLGGEDNVTTVTGLDGTVAVTYTAVG